MLSVKRATVMRSWSGCCFNIWGKRFNHCKSLHWCDYILCALCLFHSNIGALLTYTGSKLCKLREVSYTYIYSLYVSRVVCFVHILCWSQVPSSSTVSLCVGVQQWSGARIATTTSTATKWIYKIPYGAPICADAAAARYELTSGQQKSFIIT